MATQVVMPKLSPTMEEGQLSKWLKKEGDKVSMGEPIAEIDTDKATMEMQALGTGVLRKILIQEGESAPLGQLIGIIGEPDEDISALLKEAGAPRATAQETAPPQESAKEEQPKVEPPKTDGDGAAKAAPASHEKESRSGNGSSAAPARAEQTGGSERLIVSPIAARMAAEAGINLRSLTGSGPGGRIVKRDVEAAMKTSAQPAQQPTTPQTGQPARTVEAKGQQPVVQPQIEGASPYREEPMSEMRRTIARRLSTSLGPVPHFFLTTEIEMDKAAEARRSINELNPDSKVSLNDLIIKVAALALLKHPQVNSSFQEKSIRYYERADIGVAVAVEEGLITPIVRAADRKGLGQIAAEIKELADRARARRLRPEEYTGATFSVSNLGMFGIDEFTAIINPPEAAILAVGAMTPRAVVSDGEVLVKQMMRVTMSCDHRVIDGATGAQFLQTFRKMLENPITMMV